MLDSFSSKWGYLTKLILLYFIHLSFEFLSMLLYIILIPLVHISPETGKAGLFIPTMCMGSWMAWSKLVWFWLASTGTQPLEPRLWESPFNSPLPLFTLSLHAGYLCPTSPVMFDTCVRRHNRGSPQWLTSQHSFYYG